ncbi:hypothetical protein D3C86_1289930 [compost metagenome]
MFSALIIPSSSAVVGNLQSAPIALQGSHPLVAEASAGVAAVQVSVLTPPVHQLLEFM